MAICNPLQQEQCSNNLALFTASMLTVVFWSGQVLAVAWIDSEDSGSAERAGPQHLSAPL